MSASKREGVEHSGVQVDSVRIAAERAAFESARIENLLHFASLSPEQRVKWNSEMVRIMQAVKNRRAADLRHDSQ